MMDPDLARKDDSGSPSLRSPDSPFRAPGFRRYWTTQLCAGFASQMQGVAIGWQVYVMTHCPLDLGFVGLAQFLPVAALALVAGHVADRYDRRRVFGCCLALEVLCAALLLMLTMLGNTKPLWVFGVLLLAGTARAFKFPATSAL